MDASLIADLTAASKQEAKAGKVKRTRNAVWDHPELTLDSWKLNEWDYYNSKLNLPIRARGLFTKGDKIVVRGYDKFFNMGETSKTSWQNIFENTTGPYAVTLKENGCKVMVAGYEGKLIVTSKHSTGPRDGSQMKNHSLAAYTWIKNRLKAVGKTERELADELEKLNLTGVGEFCDDSFEEHVLAYPPEDAGIYFNGLNENTRAFITRPPQEVNDFGAKYGFLRTDFLMIDNPEELKSFLEGCAKTGSYNGRDVEGFVVRCKQNGEDFFFKFKFEEPYLMYRTWREATKAVFKDPSKNPKFSRHRESTAEYLKFLRSFIQKNPEFKDRVLNEGKGIIELREKFIEYSNLDPDQLLELSLSEPLIPKYALIPVATLGCGKTTVAMTLASLFGWGHIQNDNESGKSGKFKGLMGKVGSAFVENDVVIIDRNNHQFRERRQLLEALDELAAVQGYEMHYVCLNFLPNGPTKRTWEVTRKRVEKRGENHQTIRNMDSKMVDNIMKGFVGRFQPVTTAMEPDSAFELVVDVDCLRESLENVLKVISALRTKYGLKLSYKRPKLDKAYNQALAHKVEIKTEQAQTKKKFPGWLFFGLLVDSEQFLELCAKYLHGNALWEKIRAANGAVMKSEFHVTLAHKSGNPAHFKNLKGKFQSELNKAESSGFVLLGKEEPVVVKNICWNSRIVAAEVELPGELVSANFTPHITIGMAKGAQAKEANDMFKDCEGSVKIEPTTLAGKLFVFR